MTGIKKPGYRSPFCTERRTPKSGAIQEKYLEDDLGRTGRGINPEAAVACIVQKYWEFILL